MFFEKLRFQLFNALCFLTFRILALSEGCNTVFKELLLPVVEDRRLQLILVAQILDWDPFYQVTLEDSNFLLGCVVVTLLSHGPSSVRDSVSQIG